MAGVIPGMVAAQPASDRAAWDALVLSPLGGLAPIARYPVDDDARQANVWLRYGRWRYDVGDAIHNNIGITVFHELPFANSELSLTGAYLSLSCATCPSWVSGGVGLQTTVLQSGAINERSGSVGLRADAGGAHYRGSSQTTAGSVAGSVVLGAGLPFIGESHLSATVSPGIAVGRIALVDGIHTGVRRTIGAALALILSSGFAVNLGMQKMVIAGGPTELGAGIGWSR
jgi:hypothetical protein